MERKIQLINVKKIYDKIRAVDGVNVEFSGGKFYGIRGRSGSGKSTLLGIMGLLDKATSGDVLIEGILTTKMTEKQKAKNRMNNLGFIFQDFHLNPCLTAVENVIVPMVINPKYKKCDLHSKALELLSKFDMQDRSDHLPSMLSGGEKQRVAIARALANDPTCILGDEPTGNLDEENERIIFENLKKLSQNGKTVIVVSHNPMLEEYADEMYTMKDGKLC